MRSFLYGIFSLYIFVIFLFNRPNKHFEIWQTHYGIYEQINHHTLFVYSFELLVRSESNIALFSELLNFFEAAIHVIEQIYFYIISMKC